MSALTSFFEAPVPAIGIEIASGRVTVVRLAPGSQPATIAGAAVEPLPPGAVVPALNEANVLDRAAVVRAISRALELTGSKRKRAVLVVPDTVARVSLLRFEHVPAREADLVELIRWQTRKSVPFRVEDAQLTFCPGGAGAFVVVLARRDIVAEYESVCQEAGAQIGVVDLATFNLVNAVAAGGNAPDADWLLVNAAGEYLSLAILRGRTLLFFRHSGSEGEEGVADVVHQTAMYYEDRLHGSGFTRVVLASTGGGVPMAGDTATPDQVRRELEARLRVRVDSVDPRPAVVLDERISQPSPLLDTLAPAVGLLLRERTA